MTNSGLIVFLPLVAAFVGAIVGAFANGLYRDWQDKKAKDRERDGLLLLIHAELHFNEVLLALLNESPRRTEGLIKDPYFKIIQTETWTSSRVPLAELLNWDHMAALVMYYQSVENVLANMRFPGEMSPRVQAEAVVFYAREALQYSESAMR